MKIFVILFAFSMSFQTFANALPSVEDKVWAELGEKGTTTVLLQFKGPKTSDLVTTYTTTRENTNPTELARLLKSNSDLQQASTLKFLEVQQRLRSSALLDFHQIWALNVIVVNGVDDALLKKLTERDDIARIEADQHDFHLDYQTDIRPGQILNTEPDAQPPILKNPTPSKYADKSYTLSPQHYEWGVMDVGGPEVWERGFSGRGVAVGVIDTGIRHTHVALQGRLIPNYGWLDAVEGKPMPEDLHGHGTHVAGTIVGSNGIGVAPNASLLVCRVGLNGTKSGGFTLSQFMRCAQHMFCPTDKIRDLNQTTFDCSTRPRIISNSWSNPPSRYFDEIMLLWRTANQIVIFSNGNEGLACSTTVYPALLPDIISVGAINQQQYVAEFSSRGPVIDGNIKPDFVAPGYHVLSAGHDSDTDYQHKDGTSMAAPHVAGVAALLLEADPGLTQEDVRRLLRLGATNVNHLGQTCGGILDSSYPNNVAGHGKVNALLSLRDGGYLPPK